MVGQKVRALMLYFFALVQELIDRPSYINEQLLEHDAYISCLQLKKVNVAHDAMHNNYLYNHTAYYHVLQQVIAFLVMIIDIYMIRRGQLVGICTCGHMTGLVVVVVLGFYFSPTAKVIRRRDLGLKSHPKDWRSPGSNS